VFDWAFNSPCKPKHHGAAGLEIDRARKADAYDPWDELQKYSEFDPLYLDMNMAEAA
jgi:hypothetical protein